MLLVAMDMAWQKSGHNVTNDLKGCDDHMKKVSIMNV
jgi:hypothetical protein